MNTIATIVWCNYIRLTCLVAILYFIFVILECNNIIQINHSTLKYSFIRAIDSWWAHRLVVNI